MEGKVAESETVRLGKTFELNGTKDRPKMKEDGIPTEENATGSNFSTTLDDQNDGFVIVKQQRRLTPVPLGINENLQNFLVDDWHMIHLEKMLVSLPASETVDHLFEQFSKSGLKRSTGEMIETLRRAFNGYFGSEIIYTPEKWQDVCMTKKMGKDRSSVYGGIHLIRMIARFGWCTEVWENGCTQSFTDVLEDFLQFLTKKASTIFSECNYIRP